MIRKAKRKEKEVHHPEIYLSNLKPLSSGHMYLGSNVRRAK
jgi:hypothetical protein